MSETLFAQAQSVEKISIVILLTECGLSIREMNSPGTCFIVAKQEGKIIGCIGLENCGKTGLLHSLAVKRDFRGRGLGRLLYEKASEQAQDEGVEEFYVLTRASEGLFAKWGFQTIDREEAPAEINDTNDFKNDIFATYTCMKKKLERKPAAAAPVPVKDVQSSAVPVVQEQAAQPAEQPVAENAAVKDKPPVTTDPAGTEEAIDVVIEPVVAPSANAAPVEEGSQEFVVDPAAVLSAVVPDLGTVQAAAASIDELPADAAAAAEDPDKTIVIEPPVASDVSTLMQESLQELENLPDNPPVDNAPLTIPSPDVALTVPDDATLVKIPSNDPISAASAVANTPQLAAPASAPATASGVNVQHFPADRLPLVSDLPGARAWGVSLSKTMLKYYEMASETQQGAHTHGYEHITMVVDGQLFFGVGEKVISVRGGEMLAMPANVPHTVFTREQPAKAFEAVALIPGEGDR